MIVHDQSLAGSSCQGGRKIWVRCWHRPFNSPICCSMTATAPIPFRKMNGLGNDFVVLDARVGKFALSGDVARAISDRDHGIGCDQFIVLERSPRADVLMRIFNADGGEVEACGNAMRCVAIVIAAEKGAPVSSIETKAGVLSATVLADGTVSVDMGVPRFGWEDIPLSEPFHDTRKIELQIGPIDAPILHSPSVVNIGNPHCIFWVDDPAAHDLARFGPLLENHPIFPSRANISLAQVASASELIVRTWERGVGLTRACGTAACASAVAAARKNLTGRKVAVQLPGGRLAIDWNDDDHVIMSGPAELDYESTLDPAILLAKPA